MRPLLYREIYLRDSKINSENEKQLILFLKENLEKMLKIV